MTGREPAQNIDDDAAAWVAQIDRGLTESEQTELNAWLEGDARRLGAFARARAIWLHAKHAQSLAPLMDMEACEPPRAMLSRRSALLGGGALAAGLAVAIAVPTLLTRPLLIQTAVGEIRRVPLGDGSMVTLDTDSVIEVAFSKAARTVRLRSGGAFFEVAADAARPFIVETGRLVLRAAVSAFSVQAIAGMPLSVVVSLGTVMLVGVGDRKALAITPDTRVTFGEGNAPLAAPPVQAMAPGDIERMLSWRSGMLAFEGETLGEAAARFRRYGLPAIEITDPKLASKPITGLFTASDPAGFARAIALSLDARAESNGHVIKMTSKRIL